ncbi:hypothetical protein ACQRAV_01360 [Segatella copri]|uniref:hypothetical protein n=1 Tax=Segatella copri TaxID=165179 RepID=UPI003D04EBC2
MHQRGLPHTPCINEGCPYAMHQRGLTHTPCINEGCPYAKKQRGLPPYALKGQKLLAQGIALGIYGRKPIAL